MSYIIIIVVNVIFLALLWFVCGLSIKKIKQIAKNQKLDELTQSFPENIDICRNILKKLNNENVKIKEEKESKTSLYVVVNDTITIANIKDSFTRIQTIAHECIHSIQNKKMLWFNFIYTNIFFLYFLIISILTLFNIIKTPNIFLIILIIAGMIHYFIRSMLETDAMTKARYVAKEYLEENNICDKNELNEIISEYDKLNNIGIKFVNYQILAKNIIKIIMYCLFCII